MSSFAKSSSSSSSAAWSPNTDSTSLTNLKKTANYIVQESYTAETQDHEDHTFCGVMFDVQIKRTLPLNFLEISSIWVRGGLGPLGVYWCQGSFEGKSENSTAWTKVYEKVHPSSPHTLVELKLDTPIHLQPGQNIGVYVHSRQPGDQAIVYDNQRGDVTHDDVFMRVTPGMAHISNVPFSKNGMWGWGWRPNREFVGRFSYGVRYQLFNPSKDSIMAFPRVFRATALTLLMCHNRRECPLYRLPHAVILFVLNMMPWNWNGELTEEEKPTKTTQKPTHSKHQGRSYYHRIHRSYYNHDDDEEDEDDDEWVAEEDDEDDEETEEQEYVQFGGIALPASIVQSELFQDRPEVAAWLIQQILQQQADEEEEAEAVEAAAQTDTSSSSSSSLSSTSNSASSSALLAGPDIMEMEEDDDEEECV